jgi:hypothetical protein
VWSGSVSGRVDAALLEQMGKQVAWTLTREARLRGVSWIDLPGQFYGQTDYGGSGMPYTSSE